MRLESLRMWGYGYTAEFPVCGLYRDARACWLVGGEPDNDRDEIGGALVAQA